MDINKVPHLSVKGGHLCMDGVDVCALAEQYGTPLYISSEKRLKENVKEVLTAFRCGWPKTSVHYASKAEASLATLEEVRAAGADVEVNSGGELFKALKAGFQGSQIVFNGVAKSEEEIRQAVEAGVKSINVDSAFELERIIEITDEMKKETGIIFRIVPDVASGVAAGVQTGTHECKFGIEMGEVPDLIRKAERARFVKPLGYHMHVGTQTFDPATFRDAIKVLLRFAEKMEEKTGLHPEIIDIGGGLPIPYFIDAPASQYMPGNLYQMLRGNVTTESIAAVITDTLKSYRAARDAELILEPGRKIAGDAFLLVTRAENEKVRSTGDEWLLLDAGWNVLSEVKTYHWYFPMVSASRADRPHTRPMKLGGPLCESGDVWMDYETHRELPDYRMMPEETEPGDLIAILECGAYGASIMNEYNGRPTAGTVMIREDGSIFESRKRGTYEDLLRFERGIE